MDNSPPPHAHRLAPALALVFLGLSLLNSVWFPPVRPRGWCLTCAIEAALPSWGLFWGSTLGSWFAFAAAREWKAPMFWPRVGLAAVIGHDLLRWIGLDALAFWVMTHGFA